MNEKQFKKYVEDLNLMFKFSREQTIFNLTKNKEI